MHRMVVAWLCCAGFGLLMFGCGPTNPDPQQTCTSAADCPGDQLCYLAQSGASQCVANCSNATSQEPCGPVAQCVTLGVGAKGCVPGGEQDDEDAGADTGRDTGPVDTGVEDSGATDTERADTAPEETGPADTGEPDTGVDGGDDAGGSGCSRDNECAGMEVCDDNGNCVPPSSSSAKFVQIKDVTPAENPQAMVCGNDDPGSDIFAVELRDQNGITLGWGDYIAGDLMGSNNTHTNAQSILDGDGGGLMTNQMGASCPIGGFSRQSVVSLGCEGVGIVDFKDPSDQSVDLQAGHEIVVYEYGGQCCRTPSACPNEHYSVSVCSAESGLDLIGRSPDSDGDWPTCKNGEVLRGFGQSVGTITPSTLP